MSVAVETSEPVEGTWHTLRRGLALSPELRTGLAGTLALALVSMIGRAAVPVAVQQGIDHGLTVPGGLSRSPFARIPPSTSSGSYSRSRSRSASAFS